MAIAFADDVHFQRLLSGDDEVDLVRLMLEFGSDAYCDLDWLECLAEIDRLGQTAARRVARCGPDAQRFDQLCCVSQLLYQDEGFHGNDQDYYDPRNSYLNEVLSRRCGIPISLAIVYMAVAQSAGLPVVGVAAPGHFVLGCWDDDQSWYIDPFNDGEVMSRPDCQRRIEEMSGCEAVLPRAPAEPTSAEQIAVRVLRNLKAAHAMRERWHAVLPVQQRLTLLLPENLEETRDLGLVCLRVGRARDAARLLEAYMDHSNQQRSDEVEPFFRCARRMLTEMN